MSRRNLRLDSPVAILKHLVLMVSALVAVFANSPAAAQQAQVRASARPHYVNVPVDIEIVADGFEQSPEPTIAVSPPSGATLTLTSVSPNVSSKVTIINGNMTREESVRFVYRYRLLAAQPGKIDVGPFVISQNARSARTQALQFDIASVPSAEGQRLTLVLPEGPTWVGQRAPVTVQWWLTEAFVERLAGRRAHVPLFDQLDRFKFEDSDLADARTTLVFDTAAGALELPATIERAETQGEKYIVVSVQRTMIPLKSGDITLEPASIVVEEAIEWSSDFFGNRRPSRVRRLSVVDEARTLSVKTPPVAGRPASYAGAIGKGFTIDISADRSVVQTGDPVRLTVRVQGDAALETVALPALTDAGLSSDDFKIPQGEVAGIIENGTKRFDVVLRVKHDQVREIPPVALSWFNPETGQYETTYSRPVAVSVRTASMVSADDVVRPTKDEDVEDGTQSTAPTTRPTADAPPRFTLEGAELAIETQIAALSGDTLPWYAKNWALFAMYACGACLVGLAFLRRKQASIDPLLLEQRATLTTQRQGILRAKSAGDVADALRRMAAAATTLPRAEYDAVLAECDTLAYARNNASDGTVDASIKARALALADTVLEANKC